MDGRECGRNLQEKFEFYLLGLIFTILALGIQTAKFDNLNGKTDIVAAFFELASWIALLFSGLVGLSRMEWIPVAHLTHIEQRESEVELQKFKGLADRGISYLPVRGQNEPASIESLITDRKQYILRMEENKKKYEASTRKKYVVHKRMFAMGMFLLVLARGTGPVNKIYKAIVKPAQTLPATVTR